MQSLKSKRILIEGAYFYDVKTFAAVIDRTTQTVYNLIRIGNGIRKLQCKMYNKKPYIPIGELTDFPFLPPGPLVQYNVYHYDEEGRKLT
jgi:hypothetical protein